MKRSIIPFVAAFLMQVIPGLGQSLPVTSHTEHGGIYPLVIALIMLVAAISTRMISKRQSGKQSL